MQTLAAVWLLALLVACQPSGPSATVHTHGGTIRVALEVANAVTADAMPEDQILGSRGRACHDTCQAGGHDGGDEHAEELGLPTQGLPTHENLP